MTRLTRSAEPRLVAVAYGQAVGDLFRVGNGRLVFRYREAWQSLPGAHPISVAMPLTVAEHGARATKAYLWGLLPDDPTMLRDWSRRFALSSLDVLGMLERLGEDCAGAVQFFTPKRFDAGASANESRRTEVDWLTEAEVADRLRELRLQRTLGRRPGDRGQFSLAGAQPKTALYESPDGRWGVPRGRTPTNRILKPPALSYPGVAWNEHLCQQLAQRLGLLAAPSRVRRFGDEVAFVAERFDRQTHAGRLVRVHQEDCCQALAVSPTRKYEQDGGPGVADVVRLLRAHSSDPAADVARFLDALAFNWLIGGTDAHAKNYALLHAVGPQLRLAPLYDLLSFVPYDESDRDAGTLSMAIGGEYRYRRVGAEHWSRLAGAIGMNGDDAMARVDALARRLPAALHDVVREARREAPRSELPPRFAESIAAHVAACRRRL